MDLESSFELIELAQRGDTAALERLLSRYRPRLQRWATGRLPRYAREITDTEDLVQEAMLGTFKNFRDFENRGEWALQAYLRRAIMNRVRTEMNRHRGRPRLEDIPNDIASGGLSPLQEAIGAEVFARYEAALGELSEAEREGVIARLELGCNFQEIAVLLDKPTADAARMTVTRALAKVAQLM